MLVSSLLCREEQLTAQDAISINLRRLLRSIMTSGAELVSRWSRNKSQRVEVRVA